MPSSSEGRCESAPPQTPVGGGYRSSRPAGSTVGPPSSHRHSPLWRHCREGRDEDFIAPRLVGEEAAARPSGENRSWTSSEGEPSSTDGEPGASRERRRRSAERRSLLEGEGLPVWRHVIRPLEAAGRQQRLLRRRHEVLAKEMRRTAPIGHEDHALAVAQPGRETLTGHVTGELRLAAAHQVQRPQVWRPSAGRFRSTAHVPRPAKPML